MTLIFNRLLEVVKVRAKFHQAKCSHSRVTMLTEKILATVLKTILTSFAWAVILMKWGTVKFKKTIAAHYAVPGTTSSSGSTARSSSCIV